MNRRGGERNSVTIFFQSFSFSALPGGPAGSGRHAVKLQKTLILP
jgi:hypothetical protein